MKNILIVCSGGMSSAMVVKSLEKEAQKEGMEVNVKAIGTEEYENEVKRGWNVVLIAPQVRHRLPVFEEKAKVLNIPLEVIEPQGYSPMGGPKLMKQVKKLLNL